MHMIPIAAALAADAVAFIAFSSSDLISQLAPEKYLKQLHVGTASKFKNNVSTLIFCLKNSTQVLTWIIIALSIHVARLIPAHVEFNFASNAWKKRRRTVAFEVVKLLARRYYFCTCGIVLTRLSWTSSHIILTRISYS